MHTEKYGCKPASLARLSCIYVHLVPLQNLFIILPHKYYLIYTCVAADIKRIESKNARLCSKLPTRKRKKSYPI